MFAHAPDTNDFVAGLTACSSPAGRIVLEFPYAAEFIEKSEFDTIYHEHVFYFSLTALQPLFPRHGLAIFRVEHLPIHGGSLRLFAGHTGRARGGTPSPDAGRGAAKGVASLAYYEGFASQVQHKRDLLDFWPGSNGRANASPPTALRPRAARC